MYVTNQNEYRQTVDMECDEVTDDQYRTNREEDSSGSKTKLQPEQNRED